MSQTRTVGWVLLVGAALLFIAAIPAAFLFNHDHPVQEALNPLYVPSNAVSAAGALLVLCALPAAVALGAWGLGRLGSAGAILVFVVVPGFGIFNSTLSAVVNPYLAHHAPTILRDEDLPAFDSFYALMLLAWLVGAAPLGIALLRGPAAGSRWPGYLLLASAVVTVVGAVIHDVGTQSLWLEVLADLNTFLLFVALGWLGWLLIGTGAGAPAAARGRAFDHPPAAQPSAEG